MKTRDMTRDMAFGTFSKNVREIYRHQLFKGGHFHLSDIASPDGFRLDFWYESRVGAIGGTYSCSFS